MNRSDKFFYTVCTSLLLLAIIFFADAVKQDTIQCTDWQVSIWDEHNSQVYLQGIDRHNVEKIYMDFNKMPQELEVGSRVTFCEERSKIFHFQGDWTLSEIK